MKKVGKFLKNNKKVLIAFIIGLLIAGGGIGTYAAVVIQSSNVGYTNNSQSTVAGALDTLYTRANTWIDPSDFGIKRNTAKTVMATPGWICIKRYGTVYCFGTNNWSYETDHIKQVFSDISCSVFSTNVDCNASDFFCRLYSNGDVRCRDQSDRSYCDVFSNGSVACI